jgi:hypothetical protein
MFLLQRSNAEKSTGLKHLKLFHHMPFPRKWHGVTNKNKPEYFVLVKFSQVPNLIFESVTVVAFIPELVVKRFQFLKN